MIEQVNFIEEFETSMGHIVTVKGDHVYKVGQMIENKGKRYLIKGFPIVNNERLDIINMIVVKT